MDEVSWFICKNQIVRKNLLLLTTDGLCVKTICWNCTSVYFNLQWSKDYNGFIRGWLLGWLCCFSFQTLHQTNTSLHRTNTKMRDVISCTQSKREGSCVCVCLCDCVYDCVCALQWHANMTSRFDTFVYTKGIDQCLCVCVHVYFCLRVSVFVCALQWRANITSRLDTYVYTKGSHQGALVTVMYTAWEDMMPLLMQFILTYATLPKLPERRFAQNKSTHIKWRLRKCVESHQLLVSYSSVNRHRPIYISY